MTDSLETMQLEARKLAHFIGVTRQRVAQLTEQGVLVRGEGGKYRLADNVRRYAAHLRDNPAHASEQADRLRRAKAEEVELRTAERRHELVRIDEVTALVDFTMGPLVVDLDSVAPRIARGYPYSSAVSLRNTVEAELGEVRNRAADRFAAKAAELRSNGKVT